MVTTRVGIVAWVALACVTSIATPSGYRWELPAGFPQPSVPADNPMSRAKVELGRYLFHDPRLSGDGDLSCASCHRQELAFTDGRARAVGTTGEIHPRGSMALGNVAYASSLTWADGSIRRLEDQARIPMLNTHPVEMGVRGAEDRVLSRLRDDARYRALFARAFPGATDPIDLDHIARALASFERTLLTGNSPYDRVVYLDDRNAMSPEARRGMRLFFSEEIGCTGCHAGFNFSGPVTFEGAGTIEPVFHNTGLDPADRGLEEVTGHPRDRGRFRAPSLRNVALSAPYMHDGSFGSLEDVIRFYAAGGRGAGRADPNKSERITGFELDETGVADLVAFLRALTDEEFLRDPRFASPFDRVD